VARPQLRLLVDENLSPRIARALSELGYQVQSVHEAEGLGASQAIGDPRILEVATRRRQTIVTVNIDMALLCVEAEESVIWIDPRRRAQFSYAEMVVRFFQGVPVWEDLLANADVIHAMKTRDEVLSFDEARTRLLRRLARQRQARRHASKQRQVAGQVEGEFGD
jgi:predicted nuclease of predicted toxin-antitoxin system